MPEPGSQPRAIKSNWIDAFLEFTAGKRSPEIFRLWSAIVAVGGALEHRAFIENDKGRVCPNLYVLLVSPPGIGKSQAITPVRSFWARTHSNNSVNKLAIGAEDMTKAALLDELYDTDIKPDLEGNLHRNLLIAAEEFSTLLAQMDQGFSGVLSKFWDNAEVFRERRRTSQKQDALEHPQVTLLGGVQPATLQLMIPELSWGQGMMARFVMVYSETPPPKGKLTSVSDESTEGRRRLQELHHHLEHDMISIANFAGGRMHFTPEADRAVEALHGRNFPPVPTHLRLEHYNQRRPVLFLKLCIVSSMARSSNQVIEEEDVERALAWMLEAEKTMPDIFRAMSGNSDQAIIEELHNYAALAYVRIKDKIPYLPKDVLYRFLQARVPVERIDRLLNAAVQARYLQPYGGEVGPPLGYIPLAKPFF